MYNRRAASPDAFVHLAPFMHSCVAPCPTQDMYAYYEDGSGWERPAAWQTPQQLMRALSSKPPWLAAWDRLMRTLIRWGRGWGGRWAGGG